MVVCARIEWGRAWAETCCTSVHLSLHLAPHTTDASVLLFSFFPNLADCTAKGYTLAHHLLSGSLPGAQPTAEARQAPGSRPSLA